MGRRELRHRAAIVSLAVVSGVSHLQQLSHDTVLNPVGARYGVYGKRIIITVRSSFATLLVAFFTLIGIGDFVVVGYTATNAGAFQADIGSMWFVLVLGTGAC